MILICLFGFLRMFACVTLIALMRPRDASWKELFGNIQSPLLPRQRAERDEVGLSVRVLSSRRAETFRDYYVLRISGRVRELGLEGNTASFIITCVNGDIISTWPRFCNLYKALSQDMPLES